MTKRQRDTQLTREELEKEIAEEEDGGVTAVQGGSHMADISVLKQRKIVKVKRHNPVDSTVTTEVPAQPPSFVIAGGRSLSSVTKLTSATASQEKENANKTAQEA
jgi:hypothetical protein